MHHVKRLFDYFWQHQKWYNKQMQISFWTWPGGLSAGESGDPPMCKFWSFKVQIRSNFFIELENNQKSVDIFHFNEIVLWMNQHSFGERR